MIISLARYRVRMDLARLCQIGWDAAGALLEELVGDSDVPD